MISNEEREKLKEELKNELLKEFKASSKVKICENCGKEFIPIKSYSRFCSYTCCIIHRRQQMANLEKQEREQSEKEKKREEKLLEQLRYMDRMGWQQAKKTMTIEEFILKQQEKYK